MKEFIRETHLNNNFPQVESRVFDPEANIRESFSRTPKKELNGFVTEITNMLDYDLNIHPQNRLRLDESLFIRRIEKVNVLNDIIEQRFTTNESQKQAGAFAELYLKTLITFRKLEHNEESIKSGINNFYLGKLLITTGNYRDACFKFKNYVKRHESQDNFRFATSNSSDKRISNYFDGVISTVNSVMGIEHPDNRYFNPVAFNYRNIHSLINY